MPIGFPAVNIIFSILLKYSLGWFGLRKDICQFLISDACPCLQEYGNISYKIQFNDSSRTTQSSQQQPINEDVVTNQPITEHKTADSSTPTTSSSSALTVKPLKACDSKEVLVSPVVFIAMPD